MRGRGYNTHNVCVCVCVSVSVCHCLSLLVPYTASESMFYSYSNRLLHYRILVYSCSKHLLYAIVDSVLRSNTTVLTKFYRCQDYSAVNVDALMHVLLL